MNIIEFHKLKQKRILEESTAFMGDSPEYPKPFQYDSPCKIFHREILINLKEYMEDLENIYDTCNSDLSGMADDIRFQIKELTKIIEAYND